MLLARVILLSAICIPAFAAPWNDTASHPRPDWARRWVNLNGNWRFAFDPNDAYIKQDWYGKIPFDHQIKVPFCWQSELSGVYVTDYQGVAWYERNIDIPADAGPRIFVVFGAVDWEATVWANGKQVGSHVGGYTPFEVELTGIAKPGESLKLTVRVVDNTKPDQLTGKQVHWYTPTSGIWQTVYLESRGEAYLKQAHIYPDIDAKTATFKVLVEAPRAGKQTVKLHVNLEDKTDAQTASLTMDCKPGENAFSFVLPIKDPALWTPDSPNLYDAQLELSSTKVEDTVNTYFGMRKISSGKYADSTYEYILLNNKPIYLRGALHQSFNPKGIYTHPDDAFIRNDYEKAKSFGLNFLRIHIKTEEPRALYWADKLGVMLMCDVPNYWQKSADAPTWWQDTMHAQIARDFNHPAIISFCLFNETWGIGDKGYDSATQDWVHSMYLDAKSLDPTRLIEDNSPCNYDHTVSDINSWHFYIDNFEHARDHIAEVDAKTFPGSQFNYAEGWKQGTAPLINSEYGGVSAGSGDRDISWVFLFLTNQLRKHEKICGYIYTELEDIEWEHNGFMNYDRSDKVFDYPAGITVAELQNADLPVFDCPPYQVVKPGDKVTIPILLSHWSELKDMYLCIWPYGSTVDGKDWYDAQRPESLQPTLIPIRYSSPYTVGQSDKRPCIYEFTAPEASGLINIVATVSPSGGGRRISANYCVINVEGGKAWNAPTDYAVSIPVSSFAEYTFTEPGPMASQNPGKVFGYGPGSIAYRVKFPKDLDPKSLKSCTLDAEVGSKAQDERLDWPAKKNPQDYPQTDGRTWPTDVTVSINKVPVKTVSIANDYADAKGVLSHVANYQHGSHGDLENLPIEGAALDTIKSAIKSKKPITLRFEVKADAAHVGGLSLYGKTMGMWPSDPTLVFQTDEGVAAKLTGKAEVVDAINTSAAKILQTGSEIWHYTTTDPGADWTKPDFNDSKWQTGKSGFGTEGTPGAKFGTKWDSPDIWLRTTIKIPKDFGSRAAWLTLHHDEDAQIFVNGTPLLQRKGFTSDYERVPLTKSQLSLFSSGKKNLIAVHCHQTGGGQFIDLGIATLNPAR